MLSVIIPANNEAGYIGHCLDAVLASNALSEPAVEIIVAANACTDSTVAEAQSRAATAKQRGWTLAVLDIPSPGKLNALNVAECTAAGDKRLYLDADIVVEPALLGQIDAALDRQTPVYATGTVDIIAPPNWVSRAYRRVYRKVPYNTSTIAGYGLFAVNAAGRTRWGPFPDIIADDQFVRLQFDAAHRIRVPARYAWPLAEGFGTLVKVRRRQDRGNAEIASLWPEKMTREDKTPTTLGWMISAALRDPIGFLTYASVIGLARLGRDNDPAIWARGR
ncbi:MAG: glycosyltransferase [Qingshengfaniella sp.]